MIRPEHPFAIGEGLLEDVSGLLITPQPVKDETEDAATGVRVGVIRSQDAHAIGEGPLKEIGGFLMTSQGVESGAEVVAAVQRAG